MAPSRTHHSARLHLGFAASRPDPRRLRGCCHRGGWSRGQRTDLPKTGWKRRLGDNSKGEAGLQIEDWEVHFVAPGRKGPFFVRADAWCGPAGRLLARFTLVDEGQSEAVVASGTATFRS